MDRHTADIRDLADRFEYPEIWHEFGLLDLGQLMSDAAALEEDPRIERYRYRAMTRLVDSRPSFSEVALARFLTLIDLEPDDRIAGMALDYLVESDTLSAVQLTELLEDERLAARSKKLEEELLIRHVRDDIRNVDAQIRAASHGGRKAHLFLLALPTAVDSALEVLVERGADRSIRNQARERLRKETS